MIYLHLRFNNFLCRHSAIAHWSSYGVIIWMHLNYCIVYSLIYDLHLNHIICWKEIYFNLYRGNFLIFTEDNDSLTSYPWFLILTEDNDRSWSKSTASMYCRIFLFLFFLLVKHEDHLEFVERKYILISTEEIF
jgi:hypothetical protein